MVGIQPKAGTETQFAGIVEDITAIDFGEKDIEGIKMVSGGNAVKKKPMTDESVTLKLYPVSAGVSAEATATGVDQMMHPVADSTQPISVSNSLTRTPVRLVMLWSTTLPASAGTATISGEPAFRIQVANAYVTKIKPTYDDKTLGSEVTLKWVPYTKTGTSNKKVESTDGTQVLAIADAYT